MGVAALKVKIGCCGFPMSRSRYYELFGVVEVQQTFYKLPSPDTLKRWKDEAPKDFEFTVKAWQVITHSPGSPTWRKAGITIDSKDKDYYGLLKPTSHNFNAWKQFIQVIEPLNPRVIVIQTPPSLKYNEINFNNVLKFFKYLHENFPQYLVGWEPRGNWKEHLDKIEVIVKEANIIHIVDPFKLKPIILNSRLCYFRLHGIGPGEVNYRYRYTDKDFEKLVDVLRDIEKNGIETCYIMFNNVYMRVDALRFKEYLTRLGLFEVI